MGIFGEIPMSTKVPTFIGKPIEDIKAVNAELYAKYNQNKEAMDAIDIQMSKIDARKYDKPYINELSNSIKTKFDAVKNNPFKMPYANTMVSDTFKNDVVMNKKLNAIIKQSSNYNSRKQAILSLNDGLFTEGDEIPSGTTGSTKSKSSNKEHYLKDHISKSLLFLESSNQEETKIDENGTILNPIKSYNPVPFVDMTKELIDTFSKAPTSFVEQYLGQNIKNAPIGYFIKQKVESLSPQTLYNLGKELLGNNPRVVEFAKQEVFFAKIDNTNRDENGLLKFKDGELDVDYDLEKFSKSSAFRNYLTMKYEKLDTKKNKTPVDEAVGLVGTNDKDFLEYFKDKKNIEKEYSEFVYDKSMYGILGSLSNAFAITRVSYNEIANKFMEIDYAAAVKAKADAQVVATQANTKIQISNILDGKSNKQNWNLANSIFTSPNVDNAEKMKALNNMTAVLYKQIGGAKATLDNPNFTFDTNNVNLIVSGIAEAMDKGLFKDLTRFAGNNNNLKNIAQVLNAPIILNGKPLTNQQKAIYLYDNYFKDKSISEVKEYVSILASYSQLNSKEENSPLMQKIKQIASKNNISTDRTYNENFVSLPYSADDVTKNNDKAHPTSQLLEANAKLVNNQDSDYHVIEYDMTKQSFLKENEFKAIIIKDSANGKSYEHVGINYNNIIFKPTGLVSPKNIGGYYNVMSFEMFDKEGNQVFMQGANGEMVKSISMGNSNRAEGANQQYEMARILAANEYNDPNTRSIGFEMMKNVIVGDVDNIDINYTGIQSIQLNYPQNAGYSSDNYKDMQVQITKQDNGSFDVELVRNATLLNSGEQQIETEKIGNYKSLENFKADLFQQVQIANR